MRRRRLAIRAWFVVSVGIPAIALATSEHGVLDISALPGGDLGERIEACVRELPPSGGVCDARGVVGEQKVAHTLEIRKAGVEILLGAATVRVAPGQRIRILANGVGLIGIGRRTSAVVLGAGSGIDVGSEVVVRHWRIEKVAVVGATGVAALSGLRLENAREGRIGEALITGFDSGATGIEMLRDSYSNVLDDVHVTANTVGLAFVGTNANAVVIRSCIFARNVIGVLFAIERGVAQGVSFVDGTHFEGNESAGVLFRSGDLSAINFSEVYVEALKGERFIDAVGAGTAPLSISPLRIAGGYIYTNNQPPISIDATASASDEITAVIDGVHMRTSAVGVPIVAVAGKRASATVRGVAWRGAGSKGTDGGAAPILGCEITSNRDVTIPDGGLPGRCVDTDVRAMGAHPGVPIQVGVPPAGFAMTAISQAPDWATLRICRIDRVVRKSSEVRVRLGLPATPQCDGTSRVGR